KSTLIRTLAGLHRLREGTVELPPPRVASTRSALAYVPQGQQRSFFPWASLEMNILLTFRKPLRDLKRNRELIRQTCATLGLDLDMSLHPGQCSGGMLQQAALVRALCQS